MGPWRRRAAADRCRRLAACARRRDGVGGGCTLRHRAERHRRAGPALGQRGALGRPLRRRRPHAGTHRRGCQRVDPDGRRADARGLAHRGRRAAHRCRRRQRCACRLLRHLARPHAGHAQRRAEVRRHHRGAEPRRHPRRPAPALRRRRHAAGRAGLGHGPGQLHALRRAARRRQGGAGRLAGLHHLRGRRLLERADAQLPHRADRRRAGGLPQRRHRLGQRRRAGHGRRLRPAHAGAEEGRGRLTGLCHLRRAGVHPHRAGWQPHRGHRLHAGRGARLRQQPHRLGRRGRARAGGRHGLRPALRRTEAGGGPGPGLHLRLLRHARRPVERHGPGRHADLGAARGGRRLERAHRAAAPDRGGLPGARQRREELLQLQRRTRQEGADHLQRRPCHRLQQRQHLLGQRGPARGRRGLRPAHRCAEEGGGPCTGLRGARWPALHQGRRRPHRAHRRRLRAGPGRRLQPGRHRLGRCRCPRRRRDLRGPRPLAACRGAGRPGLCAGGPRGVPQRRHRPHRGPAGRRRGPRLPQCRHRVDGGRRACTHRAGARHHLRPPEPGAAGRGAAPAGLCPLGRRRLLQRQCIGRCAVPPELRGRGGLPRRDPALERRGAARGRHGLRPAFGRPALPDRRPERLQDLRRHRLLQRLGRRGQAGHDRLHRGRGLPQRHQRRGRHRPLGGARRQPHLRGPGLRRQQRRRGRRDPRAGAASAAGPARLRLPADGHRHHAAGRCRLRGLHGRRRDRARQHQPAGPGFGPGAAVRPLGLLGRPGPRQRQHHAGGRHVAGRYRPARRQRRRHQRLRQRLLGAQHHGGGQQHHRHRQPRRRTAWRAGGRRHHRQQRHPVERSGLVHPCAGRRTGAGGHGPAGHARGADPDHRPDRRGRRWLGRGHRQRGRPQCGGHHQRRLGRAGLGGRLRRHHHRRQHPVGRHAAAERRAGHRRRTHGDHRLVGRGLARGAALGGPALPGRPDHGRLGRHRGGGRHHPRQRKRGTGRRLQRRRHRRAHARQRARGGARRGRPHRGERFAGRAARRPAGGRRRGGGPLRPGRHDPGQHRPHLRRRLHHQHHGGPAGAPGPRPDGRQGHRGARRHRGRYAQQRQPLGRPGRGARRQRAPEDLVRGQRDHPVGRGRRVGAHAGLDAGADGGGLCRVRRRPPEPRREPGAHRQGWQLPAQCHPHRVGVGHRGQRRAGLAGAGPAGGHRCRARTVGLRPDGAPDRRAADDHRRLRLHAGRCRRRRRPARLHAGRVGPGRFRPRLGAGRQRPRLDGQPGPRQRAGRRDHDRRRDPRLRRHQPLCRHQRPGQPDGGAHRDWPAGDPLGRHVPGPGGQRHHPRRPGGARRQCRHRHRGAQHPGAARRPDGPARHHRQRRQPGAGRRAEPDHHQLGPLQHAGRQRPDPLQRRQRRLHQQRAGPRQRRHGPGADRLQPGHADAAARGRLDRDRRADRAVGPQRGPGRHRAQHGGHAGHLRLRGRHRGRPGRAVACRHAAGRLPARGGGRQRGAVRLAHHGGSRGPGRAGAGGGRHRRRLGRCRQRRRGDHGRPAARTARRRQHPLGRRWPTGDAGRGQRAAPGCGCTHRVGRRCLCRRPPAGRRRCPDAAARGAGHGGRGAPLRQRQPAGPGGHRCGRQRPHGELGRPAGRGRCRRPDRGLGRWRPHPARRRGGRGRRRGHHPELALAGGGLGAGARGRPGARRRRHRCRHAHRRAHRHPGARRRRQADLRRRARHRRGRHGHRARGRRHHHLARDRRTRGRQQPHPRPREGRGDRLHLRRRQRDAQHRGAGARGHHRRQHQHDGRQPRLRLRRGLVHLHAGAHAPGAVQRLGRGQRFAHRQGRLAGASGGAHRGHQRQRAGRPGRRPWPAAGQRGHFAHAGRLPGLAPRRAPQRGCGPGLEPRAAGIRHRARPAGGRQHPGAGAGQGQCRRHAGRAGRRRRGAQVRAAARSRAGRAGHQLHHHRTDGGCGHRLPAGGRRHHPGARGELADDAGHRAGGHRAGQGGQQLSHDGRDAVADRLLQPLRRGRPAVPRVLHRGRGLLQHGRGEGAEHAAQQGGHPGGRLDARRRRAEPRPLGRRP